MLTLKRADDQHQTKLNPTFLQQGRWYKLWEFVNSTDSLTPSLTGEKSGDGRLLFTLRGGRFTM